MSSVISKAKALWQRMAVREYREAFLDEAVNSRLAAQIHALRVSRGLTQAEVASLTGIAQPTLSRLESDAHGVTTKTLKRLAAAYDVALTVKFVGFNEFAQEVAIGRVDKYVPSFAESVLPSALAIESRVTSPDLTGSITFNSGGGEHGYMVSLETQKVAMELQSDRAN